LMFGAFESRDVGPFDTLTVPAIGDTNGEVLADGTPVFVVHSSDGTIYVVEAVSAHLADDAMGWCAATRTIEDVAHGAKWDETGRYVAGPARSDLGTFELGLSDDFVEVRNYLPAVGRSDPGPISGESCEQSGLMQLHPGSVVPSSP
jgi:hypothetical protein